MAAWATRPELAHVEHSPTFGTNLMAAIRLVEQRLDRPGRLVVCSDGRATAHINADGEPYFAYPP